jgi:acyl dehydratase
VYPGDTITATIEVKAVHASKPIATLAATTCANQDEVIVLEGETAVLYEKK